MRVGKRFKVGLGIWVEWGKAYSSLEQGWEYGQSGEMRTVGLEQGWEYGQSGERSTVSLEYGWEYGQSGES